MSLLSVTIAGVRVRETRLAQRRNAPFKVASGIKTNVCEMKRNIYICSSYFNTLTFPMVSSAHIPPVATQRCQLNFNPKLIGSRAHERARMHSTDAQFIHYMCSTRSATHIHTRVAFVLINAIVRNAQPCHGCHDCTWLIWWDGSGGNTGGLL